MRVYGPFLIATSMLVAINYIFAAISSNHSLHSLSSGAVTNSLLRLATVFILLVTAVFLLYVNNFLWQQRRHELGLYSMLGMTSRNIDWLLILEKCYLLIISLVAGLLIGVIFEKLAFLGLNRLLQIGHLTQNWIAPHALVKTALIIAGYFFILILSDLLKIHCLKPTELWQPATTAPQKHGVLFPLAGVAGVVALATAYYVTLTTKPKVTAINHFMLAVILVVIGTYLLFIAGSVIFLTLLSKRRHFYYRPRHFIAISGMRQRMEQNGASLATICLLCSSVLVILFTVLTLYTGIHSTVKSYTPTDITIIGNSSLTAGQKHVIQQTSRKHHVTVRNFTSYQATTPQVGYWRGHSFINQGNIKHMNTKTAAGIVLVTTTTYQRLTGQHIQLTDHQALIYSPAKQRSGNLFVDGRHYQTRSLKHLSFAFNPEHSIFSPAFMVVNRLPHSLPTMEVTTMNYRLNGSIKRRVAFENALQQRLGLTNIQFSGSSTISSLFKEMYGGLVFNGVLISLALAITTTIVIYFKQISEGYADQQRFQTMQEVGLSERETTKSIHSQVLMVFMLPIIGAVINLLFAIPAIRQIMIQLNFYDWGVMTLIATIITLALLALYLIIYGLTTKVYQQIVDQN